MNVELYRGEGAEVLLVIDGAQVRRGSGFHGVAPKPCECGAEVEIPARSSADVSVVHWFCDDCGQQFSFSYGDRDPRPRPRREKRERSVFEAYMAEVVRQGLQRKRGKRGKRGRS